MTAQHHNKERVRPIEEIACKVFRVMDSIDAVEFHGKDEVWYFPPTVHADLKEVHKFMEKAGLQLSGMVRTERGHGLAFRIAGTDGADPASQEE